MPNITLSNVNNLQDTTTSQTIINNNSAAIVAGVAASFASAGGQMTGNLDMNSNQILNLPPPVGGGSPVRLQDLSNLEGGGTIAQLPAGGAAGQVLVKTSGTDYAWGWGSVAGSITAGTNLAFVGNVINVIANPSFATSVTTPSLILNGTTLGTFTGTGNMVLATGPTVSNLTVSGSLTATGLITNSDLAGSIAASKLVGTDIATVGTVTSGTWNGTPITSSYIGTNAVSNSNLAQANAVTLMGNPTASNGNVQSFTIGGLSNNSSPNVSADKLLIYTTATGTFEYVTPNQLVSAGTAGVSTLNGLSGALTISGTSISAAAAGSTVTLSVNLANANTWTAAQTFTNSDIKLLGSSTGATTFTSANSGASNFTLTFPAVTDTLVTLAATQTLTNKSIAATQLTGTVAAANGGAGTLSGVLKANGSGTVSAVSSATNAQTPSNPSGTTSTSGVMMGLGSVCTLTPTYSGKVYVCIAGAMNQTSASQQTITKILYGTGTAPVNGAAITGTAVGNGAVVQAEGGSTLEPFSCSAIITGLTLSTAYWFDLELFVTAGSGLVQNIGFSAFEIP